MNPLKDELCKLQWFEDGRIRNIWVEQIDYAFISQIILSRLSNYIPRSAQIMEVKI